MKFSSEAHKEFYEKYGAQYDGDDRERQSLFYLLGVSEDTRRNVEGIYDFKNHCIRPECLTAGWLTSSSGALLRLALDLFHGNPVYTNLDLPADKLLEEAERFSVSNTLCYLNSWLPYAVEAIKIRYDYGYFE